MVTNGQTAGDLADSLTKHNYVPVEFIL
jgi:hypothetical protein